MYLEVQNVGKTIGHHEILKDISIQMDRGKIYGLMGINGSGKTMLMRCICGLVRPSGGAVYVDGKQLGKEIDFPQKLGALIENPGFIEHYNAFDNMMELAAIKKIADADQIRLILEEVGLDLNERKRVKKYSLGMRQKLGIAIAFMEEPELLVLDEPFNALDQAGVERVKKMILKRKAQGALVVLSCHDKEILETLSDEIYQIENGCIIGHYMPKDKGQERPDGSRKTEVANEDA